MPSNLNMKVWVDCILYSTEEGRMRKKRESEKCNTEVKVFFLAAGAGWAVG